MKKINFTVYFILAISLFLFPIKQANALGVCHALDNPNTNHPIVEPPLEKKNKSGVMQEGVSWYAPHWEDNGTFLGQLPSGGSLAQTVFVSIWPMSMGTPFNDYSFTCSGVNCSHVSNNLRPHIELACMDAAGSTTVTAVGYYTDIDGIQHSTAPSNYTFTCTNKAPTASFVKFAPAVAFEGETVKLYERSADPDSSSDNKSWLLNLRYSLLSKPSGSTAKLEAASLPGYQEGSFASFVADKAGEYNAQLIVDDCIAESLPFSSVITVYPKPSFVAAPISVDFTTPGSTAYTQITPAPTVPAGGKYSYVFTEFTQSGYLSMSATGLVSYIPSYDFHGEDTIKVKITTEGGLESFLTIPVYVSSNVCGGDQTCGATPAEGVDGTPTNSDCDVKAACGEPVNLSSGSLWHETLDFRIPGRTPLTSLYFDRHYTAAAAGPVGDLGPNWRHTYETVLLGTAVNNGSIIWVDEKGGPWRFTPQGSNYLSPNSQKARLKKFSDHFELKKLDATILYFSLAGKLLKIIEPHGEMVTLNYDGNNKLTSVSAPLAGSIVFSRDAAGKIISVTRSRDNLTYQYSYNAGGRLSQVTDFSGASYKYTYVTNMPGTKAQKMLESITDPLDRVLTFSYYENGKAFQQLEPGGGVRTFKYLSNNAGAIPYTEVKDVDGTSIRHFFDSTGRSTMVVRGDGSRAYTEWNERGLIKKSFVDYGGVTQFAYDSNGNTTSIRRPMTDRPIQIQYDQNFNKPTQITPVLGSPTQFTIDQSTGDVLQMSRAGLSLSYIRDQFGNLLGVNNGKISYQDTRDQDGLLTNVFDLHNPETRSYDSRARLSQRNFQSGRIIQYGYDDYDRVIAIIDSSGVSEYNNFDAIGRLIAHSKVAGSETQSWAFVWDEQDRLASETNPLGQVTSYTYDKTIYGKKFLFSKPLTKLEPGNRLTKMEYDELYRLKKITAPDGSVTQFTYDNRGNRTSVTDANGQVTKFHYTLNDQVAVEMIPSVAGNIAATKLKKYFWDQDGKLLRVQTDSSVRGKMRAVNFDYDSLDRLSTKTLLTEAGGVTQIEDTIQYGYENQLDATLMATATNSVSNLNFSHEAATPFKSTGFTANAVQSGNPLGLIEGSFSIARDVTGEIASVSGPNGVLFSKSYDPAGRLASATLESFDVSIGRDGFGRKTSVHHFDGAVATINYDKLNHTTFVQWVGGSTPISEALQYDMAGNISRLVRENASYNLSYNPVNELVNSTSSVQGNGLAYNRAFQFDSLGNKTVDSGAFGAASYSQSNFLLNSALATYTPDSDGFGDRIKESSKLDASVYNYAYSAEGVINAFQGGGILANYFVDGLGRRVASLYNDGTNTYSQTYLYLGEENRILQAKAGDGSITTYLDGQGVNEHLAEIKNGVGKAYITDHLGSILNAPMAGSSHSYGLAGESSAAVSISPTSSPVMYGFQGMQFMPEMGKYSAGPRLFDPITSSWTQPDPIGIAGGLNLYESMGNNWPRYKDPSGTIFGVDDVIVAVAAVGFVVGVTNAIVAYNDAHTLSAAGRAFAEGFVSGSLSAGAAVLTAGTSTALAVGLAAGVDIGFSMLTAPTALPQNTGTDFKKGAQALIHPQSVLDQGDDDIVKRTQAPIIPKKVTCP